MKLSDKEASVKMAGLCGKDWFTDSNNKGVFYNNEDHTNFWQWNPRENISQMTEVLDKIDDAQEIFSKVWDTKRPDIVWKLQIINFEGATIGLGYGKTRTEAIFQAVKKWMESEG